jgi:hypothetical protein
MSSRRAHRPKSKTVRLPPGADQSNTNIAKITGRDCSHGQCKQVRTLATQSILSDGPKAGFSRRTCRMLVSWLPLLLCTPGRWPPKGLTTRAAVLIGTAFILACLETGATGLLGQSMDWYDPMKMDIQKILQDREATGQEDG